MKFQDEDEILDENLLDRELLLDPQPEQPEDDDSSAGSESQAYLHMLSTSPEFVKLWLATIISNVGDWLTFPFLVAFSSELAKNTSLEVVAISLLFLSRTVPPLLFASLGGIVIDKFNRKHVLVTTNVCLLYTSDAADD